MVPYNTANLDQSTGCLVWSGRKSAISGYAVMSHCGAEYYVHRLAWEDQRSPIPKGMCIDHLCRNRACINVDHMEVVTRGENVLRGESLAAKNARSNTCIHGHAWTDENTYRRRDDGSRFCRTCSRIRMRKYYAQKSVA